MRETHRFRIVSALIFATLLAACAQPGSSLPPDTQKQSPAPVLSAQTEQKLPEVEETAAPQTAVYEQTKCTTSTRARVKIECGVLSVPEDRQHPEGNQIRIPVAVVRSTNPQSEPDPLVVLEGGPGFPSSISIDYWLAALQNVIKQRDVILFDQRGTGKSHPSLDCPEAAEQTIAYQDENLNIAEEIQLDAQAAQACHDRLVSEGVNLAAYTSAANAADVEDLRKALGYSRWNLFGGSYGTRLALTVMREYPEGVRSAILDSVCLPQADHYAEIAASGERAFNLLFERCAADPACNQAYPELESVFYSLVEKLDAEPETLTVTPMMSATSIHMVLNGDRFINTLFSMLYNKDLISSLPKLIYEFKEGNWMGLQLQINENLAMGQYLSEGMWFSVDCSDEAAFSSPETVQAAYPEVNPRLKAALRFAPDFEICSLWGATASPPIESQAVASEIPTLILAGEYDPIHPPSWGQQAAETLPQGQYLEFPGYGHSAVIPTNQCALSILDQFLANPEAPVDAACVAEIMPTFTPE